MILDRCARLLDGRGYQRASFAWVGGNTPPEYTDDEDVFVVLCMTLGSLGETLNTLWGMASTDAAPWGKHRLEYAAVFRPWTLEWRRVKFSPDFVADQDTAVATLCAMAQHPLWMWAVNGVWNLSGLKNPEFPMVGSPVFVREGKLSAFPSTQNVQDGGYCLVPA